MHQRFLQITKNHFTNPYRAYLQSVPANNFKTNPWCRKINTSMAEDFADCVKLPLFQLKSYQSKMGILQQQALYNLIFVHYMCRLQYKNLLIFDICLSNS